MRAFLALTLSQEVVSHLTDIQDQVKLTNRGKGTWSHPENFHLSLAFLGDITRDQADILARILASQADRFSPFSLTLDKLGYFGFEHESTLWCSVRPDNNLKALVSTVYKAVHDSRIHFESKPFKAHITLGRKINIMNCQLNSIEVKPLSFPVDGVTLFQSTLTPDGPIYRELYSVQFTPRTL